MCSTPLFFACNCIFSFGLEMVIDLKAWILREKQLLLKTLIELPLCETERFKLIHVFQNMQRFIFCYFIY